MELRKFLTRYLIRITMKMHLEIRMNVHFKILYNSSMNDEDFPYSIFDFRTKTLMIFKRFNLNCLNEMTSILN